MQATIIDIAARARSKSLTIAARQVGWSLGLRPLHRPVGRRRRAALRSAFALAMAGLAGAAFADSIPPLSPGPPAPLSTSPDVGLRRGRPAGPFEPAQSRSLRLATARRSRSSARTPRRRRARPRRRGLGFGRARPEPAWRHVGAQARPGQVRRHAHHTRERRRRSAISPAASSRVSNRKD